MTATIHKFKRPAEKALDRAQQSSMTQVLIIGFDEAGRFCLFTGDVSPIEQAGLLAYALHTTLVEVHDADRPN